MTVLRYKKEITAYDYIALNAVECPYIRTGINYWRVLRGQRRYPSRKDLKPRDIAGLLRRMSLMKVQDGDFYYSIVGDCVVQAYDFQLQGRWLKDIEAELAMFGTFTRPLYTQAAETGEPFAIRGGIGHGAPLVNFTHYENAILPLGPDDGTVDYLLVFSNYVLDPIYRGGR